MTINNKTKHSFPFEIKELNDETGEFTGYAAVFGNIDSYNDIIEPGAFKKTLKEGKTRPILWQHNPDEPIGVEMTAKEDANGLLVKGQLNLSVGRAREAYALLKQGAISGLSIGFSTVKKDLIDDVRHLKELRLWEWSLVTFPANELAQVTAIKSAEEISELLQQVTTACESLAEIDVKDIEIDSDEIKQAIEALTALLDTSEPDTTTQGGEEPQEEDMKALKEAFDNLISEVNKSGN